MNIPKVGQKYKCVALCWEGVKLGDILEVVNVDSYADGAAFVMFNHKGNTVTWSVRSYPNDFKLIEKSKVGEAIVYVSTNLSKPPLGLQPWDIHDSLRVQDILAAMQRYVAANKAVPEAWLEELIDTIELEYTQEGIYHE